MRTRRDILKTGALGVCVVASGCVGSTPKSSSNGSTDSGPPEVAAGPNGNLVFTPESVEISVGETVTWTFESTGHNVSAKPADHPKVEIPDDATPFATYEGHKTYQLVEKGESYEHTFETPGEYTYVCYPHTNSGMIGTVTVSK